MAFDVKPFLLRPEFERVIATKEFFHNNLILCLIFDTHFEIWSIDIYRVNANNWHNLHGMFFNKDQAMEKFNNIRL